MRGFWHGNEWLLRVQSRYTNSSNMINFIDNSEGGNSPIIPAQPYFA